MDPLQLNNENDLYSLAEDKIKTGNHLILELDKLKYISGTKKIQKKIFSEISYLKKVSHMLCFNDSKIQKCFIIR